MMIYRFAALDPRPSGHAANERVLAQRVLGIEVTIPAWARRCALGNIDPQHLGGDAGTAAIEAALTWPLPDAHTTLATVRADADSIGAMAVLTLRKSGQPIGAQQRARVQVIADADKEASGPWPGARSATTEADLVREATPVMHLAADHTRRLEDRVGMVAEWILDGDDSPAGLVLDGLRYQAYQEAEAALASLDVMVWGSVAVVTGTHRLAMTIGYQHAPVVLAANPAFRLAGGEPHLKYTIARWNTQTLPGMDWAGLVAALNKEDPSVADGSAWGGSTSIIGSPQGVSSGLSRADVTALVQTAVMGL